MSTSPYFKISPDAVFESFDDEVVVINMVTGSYYSLDAVALKIWAVLEQGASEAEVARKIGQLYSGEAGDIQTAVHDLLRELVAEGLLLTIPAAAAIEAPEDAAPVEAPEPFTTPVLTKFTDMQDLLLLDPIHEVDDKGWPHVKSEPSIPSGA